MIIFKYVKAGLEDIEILTKTRIEVLLAANRLPSDTDMSELEYESRRYYEKALNEGSHTAYLVYDGNEVVAAGGISYYKVMPTYHITSGMKAYIMNMYTRPEYRRKGIAIRMLELLVSDAHEKGVNEIGLETTEMGKPLYEKFGFVNAEEEMRLPRILD